MNAEESGVEQLRGLARGDVGTDANRNLQHEINEDNIVRHLKKKSAPKPAPLLPQTGKGKGKSTKAPSIKSTKAPSTKSTKAPSGKGKGKGIDIRHLNGDQEAESYQGIFTW